MSDTPLRDASLSQIDSLPQNEAEIGVVAKEDGDLGVQGHVSKDIGKPGGWWTGATGEWFKQKGWSIAAKVGWKGK